MSSAHPSHVTSLTSGTARSARSLAVAVLTVVTALGCHTVAGGAMPPAWAVVAMLAAAAPLCWALSAHRWSVSELIGVFLLAQVAVHLLSMATSAPGAMHMGGPLGMSTAMIASHVVGGTLLVLLVRRGEHLLWTVVEALALRVAPLLRAVHSTGAAPRPVACTPVTRPVTRPWRGVAVDRGPPVLHASHQLA